MSTYDQVQCPNCGGFKVTTTRADAQWRVKSSRPKTATEKFLSAVVVVIMIMPLAAAKGYITLVNCYLWAYTDGSIGSYTTGDVVISIVLGLLGVLLSIALIRRWNNGQVEKHQVVGTNYSYQCQLCGYMWSWDSRMPKPRMRIDPVLMAMGEQKLREQEEWQRMIELDALRRRVIADEQGDSG